jgi:hypothetical protein
MVWSNLDRKVFDESTSLYIVRDLERKLNHAKALRRYRMYARNEKPGYSSASGRPFKVPLH